MSRAKGEGSIFQKHSPGCPGHRCGCPWVARLEAGRTPSGGRRRLERTAGSKQAAARKLSDLRREVASGAARDGVTLEMWADRWQDDLRARVKAGRLAPKTAVGYESDMRLHVLPLLGKVRLDRLTPDDVEQVMTQVMASGRTANTARNVRATLSACLQAARRARLTGENVARDVAPPRVSRKPTSSFNAGEVAAILEACQTHWLGTYVEFCLATALRASEARGLDWSDVDLDDGWYEIRKGTHRIGAKGAAAAGVDAGVVESFPKTEGSGAATPLSTAAVEVLRRHRALQARWRLAASSWSAGDRVFTTEWGNQLDPDNVRKSFIDLLDQAGVATKTKDGRGRGLHELRRTFATRLREAGVGLEEVQRLGRWASAQTLLAHYRSLDEQRLRDAANRAL